MNKKLLILISMIYMIFSLISCSSNVKDSNKVNSNVGKSSEQKVDGDFKVHFIDVGQGDAILIQQGTHYMMIDGGTGESETAIKKYLLNQKVDNFEYIVGTHAHEDHIGSLDYIINSFKVGKVYFPKQTASTKTYENLINAMKKKNLTFIIPSVGESFLLGKAKCTVLAPNSSNYEDANDYSIVLRIEYGNKSFLFTGDAESVSEKEMLSKGMNLKSDVLKVSHHGSTSSTSNKFLSAVSPQYAVISVGKGNSYGHPAKSTMDRLKAAKIETYRTDESGTIILTSDGENITFNTSPGSYKSGEK